MSHRKAWGSGCHPPNILEALATQPGEHMNHLELTSAQHKDTVPTCDLHIQAGCLEVMRALLECQSTHLLDDRLLALDSLTFECKGGVCGLRS